METKIHVKTLDSPLPPEAFKALKRFPVTVILDNLRSAFNVGGIFRTADCALVQEVLTCGVTAHPPHEKLEKTALGALDYVPTRHYAHTRDAVLDLRAQGVPVVALELTDQSQALWDFPFPLPVALVLGNEALGVGPEILKLADAVVEIPMLGFKNSMNVAAAFSVVAYEIHRQHWGDWGHESRIGHVPT